MRILVVDDSRSNREFIIHIVQKHGECFAAENGVEALEIYKSKLRFGKPIDLVFLDMLMPVMQGQEVLETIRTIEEEYYQDQGLPVKNTVVIMVTSMDEPTIVMQAFYTGKCNGFLVKPINTKKLTTLLKANKLL